MFVRFLFLLLLALNLGAGAWLLFGREPPRALPPATDPGVAELRLLAESRGATPAARKSAAPRVSAMPPVSPAPPAAGSSTPVVASTTAQPLPESCATLGAFSSMADMRAAMQALTPHVTRIQYRQEQVEHSRGYWVYLPATATREAALDEARALAAKGIDDYYVVTAGDSQNTVSLGLFDNQANAQARLARLQKLGFPAQLKQRVDSEPAYWIDFAVPSGTAFAWRDWLPGRNDLQAKAIDCF
ncbi:MAG: SPOR domain-containing protein [Xanthomonadaceae bacterium]|nr:SPOR domain-containing protein [Xanthomonadaceae bacterium]